MFRKSAVRQILDVSGAGAERESLQLLDLAGNWDGGRETQIKPRVTIMHSATTGRTSVKGKEEPGISGRLIYRKNLCQDTAISLGFSY